MKKLFLLAVFTAVLSFVAAPAFSQHIPKWVSEKGHWIAEGNIHTPQSTVIYFYNNDNILIYKEKIEGMRLRLSRKRTLIRLKTVLEQVVMAWEKQPQTRENEHLVAMMFDKR